MVSSAAASGERWSPETCRHLKEMKADVRSGNTSAEATGGCYCHPEGAQRDFCAFMQLVRKTGSTSASAFLVALIAAVPYMIHILLTDNGIQCTFPPRYADG